MTEVWSLLREVADLKAKLLQTQERANRQRARAEYWRARCHQMRSQAQKAAEHRYQEKTRS